MTLGELAKKAPPTWTCCARWCSSRPQRLTDFNVGSLCGAGYDEKGAERLNSRNGVRERAWETRAEHFELKIPKLRQGSYFPGFLAPRGTAEEALAAVIHEASAYPPARWTNWSRP